MFKPTEITCKGKQQYLLTFQVSSYCCLNGCNYPDVIALYAALNYSINNGGPLRVKLDKLSDYVELGKNKTHARLIY